MKSVKKENKQLKNKLGVGKVSCFKVSIEFMIVKQFIQNISIFIDL